MHINTHVALGIILSLIYSYFISQIFINVIAIFSMSFLIDFDFLFSKYAKNRNHRVLPTHGIIIYLILLPFGVFFPIFSFLGLAGLIHILIDCLDWGVGIFSPFSKKIYFGILPKPSKEIINDDSLRRRQCWFISTYYKSKILMFVDILIIGISIILLFLINVWYWWYYLIYSFFLALHITSYFRCKKQKDK